MAITIKKRVSLDYLGDDYRDSFLEFKAIAIREYADLQKDINAIKEDESKSIQFIIDQLKSRFLDGLIAGQKLTADDLEDLPGDVFMKSFQDMMGQISPKD